jgi:hypothetical protein
MVDLRRRGLLIAASSAGLGLGGGARQAAAAPAAPPVAPTPDFNEPALNLLALLKILGSTDSQEVSLTYGTGRVFACLAERRPVPLFATHSVSAARSRLRADGSFVLRQHIIGFRTPIDSETPIERMVNPLTGESIDLPFTDYGTGDIDYRLDGTYALRHDGAAEKMDHPPVRPWKLDAGVLAIDDDSLLAGTGPRQPKIDVVTRFARVEEILDPKVASPRSWFDFSAVDPFRPWLKMSQPGFQLWHVHGRKVDAAAPLPEFIATFIRARFPTLLELNAP